MGASFFLLNFARFSLISIETEAMRGPSHPQTMLGQRPANVPDNDEGYDAHCPHSPMADPNSGAVVYLTSHGRKTELPMLGRTIAQMPMTNEIVATLPDSDKSLWKPQAQCPESDTAGCTLVEVEYLPGSRWRVVATPHRGKEHVLGRQMVGNAFGM